MIKQVHTITNNIEKLYFNAFPPIEQLPIEQFRQYVNEQKTNLFEFYQQDQFIGFISSLTFNNYVYITYFAVEPTIRNQGLGSKILTEFKQFYSSKTIVLAIEDFSKCIDKNDLKLRRYHFYLRNGFILNDFTVTSKMGTFNIMSNQLVSLGLFKKIADEFAPGYITFNKIKTR
ncbi:MAG: GNAT family N-acetyltransferase [Mycoplasmoidaceae bacterium]|nr:GNAT family N-acetyltransferase [Mycoplasmoidaceae bacterium]